MAFDPKYALRLAGRMASQCVRVIHSTASSLSAEIGKLDEAVEAYDAYIIEHSVDAASPSGPARDIVGMALRAIEHTTEPLHKGMIYKADAMDNVRELLGGIKE